MKHFYAGALIIFLTGVAFNSLVAQRYCATEEVWEQQLLEDPGLEKSMERIEQFTQSYIEQGVGFRDAVTIPVVVHILYHKEEENISDEQVHSQVQVLNEDFRRLNEDAINTPDIFLDRAADVQINFCLATVDPGGNPTSGIIRTKTEKEGFRANNDVKKPERGGVAAWPADQYLNIWICNLESGYDYPLLGYSQYPGGDPATDGVVLNYLAFGRGPYNLLELYNLGRTATHEIGHWLNLHHIWGGGGGCDKDDRVDDTPKALGDNNTEIPCAFPGRNSCDEGENDLPDMFQNYMDYSSDACMNLFTHGQAERMLALFAPGGVRESLLSSIGCSGPPMAPAPITDEICDNDIDDDGDGLIDCEDPDCDETETCTPFICEKPSNPVTLDVSADQAVFEWSPVEGVDYYTFQIRKAGESSWANARTTVPNYTARRLTPQTNYQWRVRARCSDELSRPSATTSFTTERKFSGSDLMSQTSITTFNNRIRVFPNPAGELITVTLTGNSPAENTPNYLFLSDINGRPVLQDQVIGEGSSIELDVSSLPPGFYILKLIDEAGSVNAAVKIIVE